MIQARQRGQMLSALVLTLDLQVISASATKTLKTA